MPHLTLQYTDNLADLNVSRTLQKVNEVTYQSGLFEEGDIKSRAIQLQSFLIGTVADDRAFIHLTVAMSPRGPQVEQALAKALIQVLEDALARSRSGLSTQACVEITHVDTSTYVKRQVERAAHQPP
jgi:5-carboxymethyl-2-hydroxymuconate isomerase